MVGGDDYFIKFIEILIFFFHSFIYFFIFLHFSSLFLVLFSIQRSTIKLSPLSNHLQSSQSQSHQQQPSYRQLPISCFYFFWSFFFVFLEKFWSIHNNKYLNLIFSLNIFLPNFWSWNLLFFGWFHSWSRGRRWWLSNFNGSQNSEQKS